MCFFFFVFRLLIVQFDSDTKLIMDKTKKNQSTKTWDVVPELGQYEVRYKGNLLLFFYFFYYILVNQFTNILEQFFLEI